MTGDGRTKRERLDEGREEEAAVEEEALKVVPPYIKQDKLVDLAEVVVMVIPLVVHLIKEIAAALLDTEMQVVLLLLPTKVQAVEVLVPPVLMHNLML